ncbi:serine/arginine repetitive matrix protein 1-like [Delphinapterus leucas]|uniref:Serine/arginine repetitive matrix protein 1-like n=1 Tax=Delphinapterus leucas TaxID=9749 RepID=A0A7F8KF00_DELLE|nr:serine/arginine repetitive matrix protein 1-like [Delphinapterus leucas]
MTQKSLRTAIDNFKTISQTQAREHLKEKLTPLSDNHWTKGTARPAGTKRLDFYCILGKQPPREFHPALRLAGRARRSARSPKSQERVTCQRGRRGLALGRWDALRPAGVLEVAARAGRRGRGKGRARRASGGDGSAEGRCEAPARREPWREAAARHPHQCPGPQQRPRPPPWGPPGRRPRAPRAPDGRALRARRPQRAAARGRAAREGALGCPSAPTNPASGTSDPEPRSAESAGGQRKEEEAPQPSLSRAPRCRPAGCCGGNRSRRAAGTRPRTTKRRRPGEPSARAAPRRRPPGSRLLRGRASCASRGFPVRSRCWCARPPGGRLPDCP